MPPSLLHEPQAPRRQPAAAAAGGRKNTLALRHRIERVLVFGWRGNALARFTKVWFLTVMMLLMMMLMCKMMTMLMTMLMMMAVVAARVRTF